MNQTHAIRYTIQPCNPYAHLFEVRLEIDAPAPDGQVFQLPAWIPGSYMIRDFARNIIAVSARSNGQPVTVEKIDKHTWKCAPAAGPLTLHYEVYAWDLSVRTAHLDQTHAFYNGTSVFLLPRGYETAPCLVDIQPPAGEAYLDWRVATALKTESAPLYGFGQYRAANYDELIDSPVEMGAFTLAQFTACGVPHDVVITGRQRADLERLTRDMKTICEHHIRFFGEPAPFDRYVFLVMAVGQGYGGLEHRASTALLCSRDDLPLAHETEARESYRNFLGLVSHEYFHSWNVKRIKPEAFLPYDLFNENYTRQLWAFEGITSYYDDLGLVRSGLLTTGQYLEGLAKTITRVMQGPGRLKQSVAESSFDAWIKFYKADENTPNAVVNYYTKGTLIALALDLTLRTRTQGQHSLDDVMRALWTRHGQPLVGVPEGAIESLAAEISGLDLAPFFQEALYGTTDLPLTTLFAAVGVRLHQPDAGQPAKSALGVALAAGAEAKVQHAYSDGSAQRAGLSAGDEILAIDGMRVNSKSLTPLIESYPPGSHVEVYAFRRDELMRFDVTLQPAIPGYQLTVETDALPEAIALRTQWLSGA